MANIPTTAQTSQQPGISTWLAGRNPIYNQLPTEAGYQQVAKMGLVPGALGALAGGWGAPDSRAIAQDVTRQYQQEVLPGLSQQFRGQHASSAYRNALRGAATTLQSKLGAMQAQQQFELQKQRQEQLPRLLQLGLQPGFQAHLTDRPIEGLPQTESAAFSESPIWQQFAGLYNQAQGYGANKIAQGREAYTGYKSPVSSLRSNLSRDKYKGFAKYPVVRNANPRSAPMIESLMRSRSKFAKQALKYLNEGDLREATELLNNKASADTWKAFIRRVKQGGRK